MPIDYERMKRSSPKLKAMLTRAQKIENPEDRYIAVRKACKAAVTEWNAVGAWVDNWSHWQRALDDAFYNPKRNRSAYNLAPRLEEL
jgi:hypothetical protein